MECMNNSLEVQWKKTIFTFDMEVTWPPLFSACHYCGFVSMCICVNVLYTLVFFHINWKLYAWLEMCIQNWILALRILFEVSSCALYACVFSTTTTTKKRLLCAYKYMCVICFLSTSCICVCIISVTNFVRSTFLQCTVFHSDLFLFYGAIKLKLSD